MDSIIENFINRLNELAKNDKDNWENFESVLEEIKDDLRLKKKLSRLTNKINEENEFDKIIGDLDKVKSELALKKLEIKNLKSANAELNSYLSDANERQRVEELAKLEQVIVTKDKEIEKLNKVIKKEFGDKKKLDLEKIKKQYDDEIKELNDKIVTQTVFNRKIRKENEVIKKQLSDEQKIFENLGETIEVSELREENEFLKDKLSYLVEGEDQVELMRQRESSLMIDLKNRDNQIEHLRSKVERDAKKIKDFEIQFQKMNSKYTSEFDLEAKKFNLLKDEVNVLTKENKILIDDKQSLVSQIRDKELEVLKLEERVNELDRRDSSESIIKAKNNEIKKIEQANEELNNKIKELRTEYNDKILFLEKELNLLIKENNTRTEVKNLKEKINNSKKETKITKEEISSKEKPSEEVKPVKKTKKSTISEKSNIDKKQYDLSSLSEKERKEFEEFKTKWEEEEFMREKVFGEDLLISSTARIEKSIKFWEINIKRLEFDRGRFSKDKVVQDYFDVEIKKIKKYIKQLKNIWIEL